MAISAPRLPGETDRGLRHSLHRHPRGRFWNSSRCHRRFEYGWKQGQAFARPVPAHRGGRRCCHRCRVARSRRERHRDRRPGTSAFQRNHRPLSEGGRRPARGRERPRGPILGRPGRGALARAVGRGAPRPHRSGRMDPPLKGGSLILRPANRRMASSNASSVRFVSRPFRSAASSRISKEKNAKVTPPMSLQGDGCQPFKQQADEGSSARAFPALRCRRTNDAPIQGAPSGLSAPFSSVLGATGRLSPMALTDSRALFAPRVTSHFATALPAEGTDPCCIGPSRQDRWPRS